MPRSGPSATDADLMAEVRGYGQQISYAQLERWCRDGIVERNERRGHGRGLGTTSRTPAGAVEAAAAMARFSKQGQSQHMAVLRWFGHVGLPLHNNPAPVIPEPPIEPLRRAMIWFNNSITRRVAALVSTGTGEDSLDEAYATAQQLIDRARVPDPLLFQRIRGIVLDDRDVPGERERVRATRAAVIHGLVARSVGINEVGADLLVDALGALGMFSTEDLSAIADSLRADELAGTDRTIEADSAADHHRITVAAASQLREARDTTRQLLACAAVLHMLRWGAPDTASLDATAERFRRRGLGILLNVGLAVTEPANLVPVITVLLDPYYAAHSRHLLDELSESSPFGDMSAQLQGMLANLNAAAARPSAISE